MSKRKLKTSFKRVFLIGAGFSAGANYPVGRFLVSELIQYLKGKPDRLKKKLPRFRNSLLATSDGKSFCRESLNMISSVLQSYFLSSIEKAGDIEITEFFSIVHALAKNVFRVRGRSSVSKKQKHLAGPGSQDYSLSKLYALLSSVLMNFFVDISECARVLPMDMRAILNNISCRQDAIVSFNWDEEVDRHFTVTKNWNVAYTLESWKSRGGILILKPHGSIGWYDVARGIGNKDIFFIAEGDSRLSQYARRIISYYGIERPVTIESQKSKQQIMYYCPPVITPPTFAKSFEYEEQNWIWQDVIEACSTAKQFVFLGYSLPKDDYLTRAAIRNALRNNPIKQLRCLIVDRTPTDQGLQANFSSVFQNALNQEDNYFPWQFGNKRKEGARHIQQQLNKAFIKKAASK